MGFFDEGNTRLETVWFSVLAAVALVCFPFGVRLRRRFPQILAAKLEPVLCLLLAYENIVLALSNVLSEDCPAVLIGRTTRAAVIPLFLVVMFEVAYAVHKRRSVKFCGIVFDQGHRRSVEPCSWFLRNFVRIVAVMIFVVGILVNYNTIVGDDEKAGGTGLVDTEDASAHLLLALLPTTGMALIALYIAVYMWKYGNDASIVVQSTICNGWILLFLGTVALLAGQVPPEWCFRVANETGQVLLLLSLIAIGREIGNEIQAADDFSSFLEKENELEKGSGSSSVSGITPAAEQPKPPNLATVPPTAATGPKTELWGEMEAAPEGDAAASASTCKEEKAEEAREVSEGLEPRGDEAGAMDEKEGTGDDDRNINDVTRPMKRPAGRSGVIGLSGGPLAAVFHKKRVSLTEVHEEVFSGLSENEDSRDTRRGSEQRAARGACSSAVGNDSGHCGGSEGPPAAASAVAVARDNGSERVRLGFRRIGVDAV